MKMPGLRVLVAATGLLWGGLAVARAQGITPLATLSCQPASGAALTETVFEFEVGIERSSELYTSELGFVISDTNAFVDIFGAVANGTVFPACTVSGGSSSVTFNQVQFVDDVLLGFGQGVLGNYDPALAGGLGGSETSLCFASYTVDGVTYPQEDPGGLCPQTQVVTKRSMWTGGFFARLKQGGR